LGEFATEEVVMGNLFLVLALVSVVLGIVPWIKIISFLSKRGVKINYLLLKVLIVKYVEQYKRITIEENGKPGLWFYLFIISMNLTLLFAVVGIILKITTE